MDTVDAFSGAKALLAKREGGRVLGGKIGLISFARAATTITGVRVLTNVVHGVQTRTTSDRLPF